VAAHLLFARGTTRSAALAAGAVGRLRAPLLSAHGGQSTSRPRCSSRNQSRARVPIRSWVRGHRVCAGGSPHLQPCKVAVARGGFSGVAATRRGALNRWFSVRQQPAGVIGWPEHTARALARVRLAPDPGREQAVLRLQRRGHRFDGWGNGLHDLPQHRASSSIRSAPGTSLPVAGPGPSATLGPPERPRAR
jgi:hypothetical protein